MVDLIVPAGATLAIDGNYQVAQRYDLFRMEANASIVASVDLALKANRAEFADNCVIDASGAAGPDGAGGSAGLLGQPGGAGASGQPGRNGRNVTIEAGLAMVGGLTILADGGRGGRGGPGGVGGAGSMNGQVGAGGNGGSGGTGGDSGQIALAWTRYAPNLPSGSGMAPQGHTYRSEAGNGGSGGAGGLGGSGAPFGADGPAGPAGGAGPNGKGRTVQVAWRSNPATRLWAQKQDIGPAPRTGHAMAFDPGRGKLVLFGGATAAGAMGDTWEWDGQLWTQVADTGPPPVYGPVMAYDPAGRQVLYCGTSPPNPPATGGAQDQFPTSCESWGWDGETWTQLADTGPTNRYSMAMACDPARGRVVLFGGQPVPTTVTVPLVDTWEWDGTQWTQLADTGPPGRTGAVLTHCPEGGVLLFGGAVPGQSVGDTWLWDGTTWRQVADTGPSTRAGHAMASDEVAAFLFGGQVAVAGSPSLHLNDTWAWYGGMWRQVQDMGPSPRLGHAMANFVGADGEAITLFGGEAGTFVGDTWRFVDRT